MRFLKDHWVSLVCGVVSLLAIVVLAIGMTRKTVVEAMNRRLAEASQIDSLRSNPQNEKTIAAERERGKKFEEQYTTTVDMAKRINRREPLLTGVFPVPGSTEVAYRFEEQYKDRLYELPRGLLAGGAPTPEEIQDEVERLLEAAQRRAEQEGEEAPAPGAPGTPAEPPGGGPRPGLPAEPAMPGAAAAGTGRNTEAELMAAIRKARSIRMYAELSPQRCSFHISPIAQLERAPTASEMWEAQVGLWVQQDIVNAIRKLNDEAAEQLPEKDRHVEFMPVKHLLDIRVFGYLNTAGQLVPFETGALAGGGGGGGPPPAAGSGLKTGALEYRPSFTGRKTDDNFDVIAFALRAIVDQREILRLVDRITRENFYQLTGIGYELLPPGAQEGTYFYGDAPVVVVHLQFEGYLARSVYKPLMPPEFARRLVGEGMQP